MVAMVSAVVSPSSFASCWSAPQLASNGRRSSRSGPRNQSRGVAANCRRMRAAAAPATDFLDLLGRGRLARTPSLQEESCGRWRGRRKACETRAGLPVISSVPVLGPLANAIFNPVVLLIIYLAGVSRFWSGFGRTTYNNATPTKVALTALWPALYVASKAYRSNFQKAVR